MADENETATIMLGLGDATSGLTIHDKPETDEIDTSCSMPGNNGATPSADVERKDDGNADNQGPAEDESPDTKTEDRDAKGLATADNDGDASLIKSPTTKNINTIETNNDTTEMPLPTPRRRIKKRREDGFVYAEDTKAEKSASMNNKQQLSPSSPKPTKPPRKRPRKCPVKDSILIEVPLSVTADLGVAMRRTRRKRIKRIKDWVASGVAAAAAAAPPPAASSGAGDESNEVNKTPTTPNDENDGNKKGVVAGGDKDEKSASKESAPDEEEHDDLEEGDDGGPLDRKQYGSIVDYLEAKYVRGVMIEDYDERERVKEKKKKKKKSSTNDENNGEMEEESDDSEGKGSCYDSDGWIDDSLLHEEVAGQVMASSAYGMTQIEEEARKRKKDKRKREKGVEDSAMQNGDDKGKISEGGNMMDGDDNKSEDGDSTDEGGGADSDFDDGFFVNLGDLEMAEGWKDENDIGPTQAKKEVKKKRAYNKKSAVWFNKSEKSKAAKPKMAKKTEKPKAEKSKTEKPKAEKSKSAKSKTVKKKNVNAKVATPVAKKKLMKKAKEAGGKKGIKKKEGRKSKEIESKQSDGKATTPKKKKKKKAMPVLESATSPKRNEGEGVVAENEGVKGSATKSKTSQSSPKESKKAPSKMSKEKEKAMQLHKLCKKKYNVCVKMIEDMTSEELPKKRRIKNMMKVSVNIPPHKSIGDNITFGNPNVPGQKLKVKIPKKANMEKRTFVVSVPGPKVTAPDLRENNFPKEFKEALYIFAGVFDDWCVAEGEYNQSLSLIKRKPFKANVEKLKKFDDLVNEFPKNLATPVDISYLRKIVRQERSNKSRRDKRKDSSGSGNSAVAGVGDSTAEKQQESEIHIPQKGTEFLSIAFCRQDFE